MTPNYMFVGGDMDWTNTWAPIAHGQSRPRWQWTYRTPRARPTYGFQSWQHRNPDEAYERGLPRLDLGEKLPEALFARFSSEILVQRLSRKAKAIDFRISQDFLTNTLVSEPAKFFIEGISDVPQQFRRVDLLDTDGTPLSDFPYFLWNNLSWVLATDLFDIRSPSPQLQSRDDPISPGGRYISIAGPPYPQIRESAFGGRDLALVVGVFVEAEYRVSTSGLFASQRFKRKYDDAGLSGLVFRDPYTTKVIK